MNNTPIGGSYRQNRIELARAMVQIEGDDLVIESPYNVRSAEQSRAVIEDVVNPNETREALIGVIYDLLTAVADDVQDRFMVQRSNLQSRNGKYPPKDPDEIVGTDLIRVFQSQTTSKPKQTPLGAGRD